MTQEILLIPDTCSIEDFELVKKYIHDFELDDRDLQREEFLVLKKNESLLGFGRIREFADMSELCSLGIIPDQRMKGLGKILCEALIQKALHPLYLVCIIPAFFEHLGFHSCDSYPLEINEKLHYCTSTLVVEEKYIAMKR